VEEDEEVEEGSEEDEVEAKAMMMKGRRR